MNDPGTQPSPLLARFDLRDGTQLTLHHSCLVHRGGAHFETVPLAAVQTLRVGFERNTRGVGWGITLMVLAVLIFVLSGPLTLFASRAAADVVAGQGVAQVLLTFFRVLEAVASLLPVVAAAAAIGGGALIYLGWRGATVLQITLVGTERGFASRGRDALMLEFAASVSERLMSIER